MLAWGRSLHRLSMDGCERHRTRRLWRHRPCVIGRGMLEVSLDGFDLDHDVLLLVTASLVSRDEPPGLPMEESGLGHDVPLLVKPLLVTLSCVGKGAGAASGCLQHSAALIRRGILDPMQPRSCHSKSATLQAPEAWLLSTRVRTQRRPAASLPTPSFFGLIEKSSAAVPRAATGMHKWTTSNHLLSYHRMANSQGNSIVTATLEEILPVSSSSKRRNVPA